MVEHFRPPLIGPTTQGYGPPWMPSPDGHRGLGTMAKGLAVVARSVAAASVVGVLLVSSAPPSSAGGFAFTTGDVVVERLGVTGGATLAKTGNPIFLDEYTPGGTLVGSVAMPTTSVTGGNQQIIESGTATFDGEMTNSADGHYLIVSGYDTTVGGTTTLTGTLSSSVPRVAASVDSNSDIDSTTALPDFANANNYRGATSPDGKTFYLSGNTGSGNGGLAEAPDGDTTASNEIDNYAGSGEVTIYNGQLYVVSKTAGTGFTVASLGPLPVTGAATPTPLPGFPTATNTTLASPDSIFLAQLNPTGTVNPDTIYVTDPTLPATGTAGEVQKWSLVGGTWSLTGTILVPYAEGLTATVSGSTVTLYVTSSGISTGSSNLGFLYSVTDTSGYDAAPSTGSDSTPLVTAATNEAFRGVALAPTPEPTTQVPETPWAILLPATAGLVLCGGFLLSRRRRAPARFAR